MKWEELFFCYSISSYNLHSHTHTHTHIDMNVKNSKKKFFSFRKLSFFIIRWIWMGKLLIDDKSWMKAGKISWKFKLVRKNFRNKFYNLIPQPLFTFINLSLKLMLEIDRTELKTFPSKLNGKTFSSS